MPGQSNPCVYLQIISSATRCTPAGLFLHPARLGIALHVLLAAQKAAALDDAVHCFMTNGIIGAASASRRPTRSDSVIR